MASERPPPDKPSSPLRLRIVARIFIFCVLLGFIGGYSQVLKASFTKVFPRTCSAGKSALFTVDFESFPTRIGDQDNLCAQVNDGHCTRTDGEETIRGECLHERMDGAWTVTNTKSGQLIWSGNYCEGLPCGKFQTQVDAEHTNEFHLDKLHLHGPATIWEQSTSRSVQFTGRYEYGRRSGQWLRSLEPAHTRLESLIYDKAGFLTSTTRYCANGNRREIRGGILFLFDAKGGLLGKRSPTDKAEKYTNEPGNVDAADPALCPMP